MRSFGQVKEATTCCNPTCGQPVPVSDNPDYTRQSVVTYTGSDLQFPYCSNRCVNEDYDRSSEAAENQNHYWDHVMATLEDEERMVAAHLAAFIEDEQRPARPTLQTITFTRVSPGHWTLTVDGIDRPVVAVRFGRNWYVQRTATARRVHGSIEDVLGDARSLRDAKSLMVAGWLDLDRQRALAHLDALQG